MTFTHRHYHALAAARQWPSLRRVGVNGRSFIAAPTVVPWRVSGAAVHDLVGAGLMCWVNKSHSAVVLTAEGRKA